MAQALAVLDRALDELANEHRQPTASLVRLTMKRLTYNGFDPKQFGFKKFRDFLEAAANDKRIELHDRPGDLLVSRRGAAVPIEQDSVRIRRDLWKATLDWSAEVAHYLDLETDKIVTVPTTPVPLEPQKFATLRNRVADADATLVRVPSVDIRTQVGWMAQFTGSVADPDIQLMLEQALASPKSAREFAQVLRSEPAIRYAWNKQLSGHVLVHLLRWKSDHPNLSDVQLEASEAAASPNDTPRSADDRAVDEGMARGGPVAASGSVVAPGVQPLLGTDHAESPTVRILGSGRVQSGSYAHETKFGGGVAVGTGPRGGNRRSRLRLALHRAIDRMPEEELARLVLPAGYLIED